jgi:predicted esterase
MYTGKKNNRYRSRYQEPAGTRRQDTLRSQDATGHLKFFPPIISSDVCIRIKSLCCFNYFFLLLTGLAIGQDIDYKGFPQWAWARQDSTEYYLYTPSGMKKGERYPVALFLHGCCGTDYHATLRNTVDPPARMWHNFGENKQTVPTYIIAPKTSRGWRQHMSNLKKVMDDLVTNQQGDPQRIYITGFSMGGSGTWEFIQKYPGYFAAALPMGMDFHGDPEKVINIPIWTSKGETDWYARNLNSAVAKMRRMHAGLPGADSSASWVTGVNPRFTEFAGAGHGIQWIASSTLDLTGWAYSKVNDGNLYPIVYFKTPFYKQVIQEGEAIEVNVAAEDPDGFIEKVDLYLNGKLVKTFASPAFAISLAPGTGDSKLEAIATDNKGKTSIATVIVQSNIPVGFKDRKLPEASQGRYFEGEIEATGNGRINFALPEGYFLPEGLVLSSEGKIKGIPGKSGDYNFKIAATDEDGDVSTHSFRLHIKPKDRNVVIVSDVRNYAGKILPLTVVRKGELPHGDRTGNEVSLSDVSSFKDLILIRTDANDTIHAGPYYIEFSVDEDVTVFVAYEKLDHLYHSTVPDWLQEFRKEPAPQIVTQYYYYDVYSKDFPKGKITFPGAEQKKNGVNTNYFVMIKKK